MVEQFSLQNMTTQQKIHMGQDASKDYLIPEGGVDWGKVSALHNTYSYPGQAGVYISSTSLRARDVTINGYVSYVLSDTERMSISPQHWVEYAYSKILQKKHLLDSVLNPQDRVRIIVGSYYLEGKPNSSVVFGKTSEENNAYFCKFQISLYCAYPMFKKISQTVATLNGTTPSFHFPLVFPRGEGIIMSIRKNYQLIAITNDGAIPTGCVIRMKSSGEVVNPRIENVFTGEHIAINKTLSSGEELVINTNDGEEKGIFGMLNGVEENYFKYWTLDSSWMKIPVGTSLIGYSVESENESLLDVTVEISPARYSLEEL